MEAHNHFTCIAYDSVDFLIQSSYIVSGVYLQMDKEERSLTFNRETLPHIYIGDLLGRSFGCSSSESYNVVLIMKMQDFAQDVCKKIVSFTETAFPATGNLALSVDGSISSKVLEIHNLHLMPGSIRTRLWECGVCAIGFSGSNRKQILLAPDMLLKRFFAAGMLTRKNWSARTD